MFFYESDADIRSWILDIRYWSDEYESDGSPPTPPPPRSQALDKKPEIMYLQMTDDYNDEGMITLMIDDAEL